MSQHSLRLSNTSAAPVARPVETHRRAEWGRKAILSGCLMALVGIVTYCYSTFQAGPDADLPTSLFQNGWAGWASFVLLVTGVGIWMAGNVALLVEADRTENEPR